MSTQKVTYTSAKEKKRWNNISELMASFHQWFKDEYQEIYESADSFDKRDLSLSEYLDTMTAFNAELTMHHTMEERYVFPVLARGIPKFAQTTTGGHVDSHKAIHDALEDLKKRVAKWREDPTSYSPTEMRTTLDALAGVLFDHLDEEVEDIKGDNLKPYFTLEEIENIRPGNDP